MTNNAPIPGQIYRGKNGRLRRVERSSQINNDVWWDKADVGPGVNEGICTARSWRRWVKEPVPTAN